MKIVKLTEVIKHNGKNCKVGESLEVSESNAARLVSLKVAEITGDAPATTQPPATTENVNASIDDIESMPMDNLKQEASRLGIAFNPNISKVNLLKLVKEAISKGSNE